MLTRERERNGQSIEESQERKHDTNWAIHSYNEWAVETEILTCVGYSHDLIRVCAWFYCTDGLTWRFLVKLSCFFLNAFWCIFSDVSATRLEASFRKPWLWLGWQLPSPSRWVIYIPVEERAIKQLLLGRVPGTLAGWDPISLSFLPLSGAMPDTAQRAWTAQRTWGQAWHHSATNVAGTDMKGPYCSDKADWCYEISNPNQRGRPSP